jgi:4-amino-4-deoxy-L-arabinose transferase-like glycosyltransferase
MAPWSVLLPAALVGAHRCRTTDSERARSDRFTMVFFWAPFVFFTLSGSRRSYYILPILPAGAILVARLVGRPFQKMTRLARTPTKVGFGVIVGAIAISTLAFLPPRLFLPQPYAQLPPTLRIGVFAIFWLGSIGAIIYAMRSFRIRRVAAAVGAIAWLFMFYFFVVAMPASEALRSEKPFAARVRALVGSDASIPGLLQESEPGLLPRVFATGSRIRQTFGPPRRGQQWRGAVADRPASRPRPAQIQE